MRSSILAEQCDRGGERAARPGVGVVRFDELEARLCWCLIPSPIILGTANSNWRRLEWRWGRPGTSGIIHGMIETPPRHTRKDIRPGAAVNARHAITPAATFT